MLRGLQIDGERMRKNLDLTGGLIVAEAVMMGLAPAIGRQPAHDMVYDACRTAIEKGRTLYDVLNENAQIRGRFDEAKLRALTDPANYLGAAAHMARSVANGTGIKSPLARTASASDGGMPVTAPE
jgi:3-carboxy-cis,cis-muconate cycloisomerase